MNFTHVNGIIIEGLSCSGKTSVFNAIKRIHGNHFERTLLAFSENYSQILYKKNGGLYSLNGAEHQKLLKSRLEAIRKIGEWGDYLGPASQASRGVFIIFERFHLNHQNTFPDSDVLDIEKEIMRCNLKTVLLTISPDNVYDRLLFRYNGDKRCASQQLNSYIEEQEKYISISKKSKIATKIIVTDKMKWDEIAENALDFVGHSRKSNDT